MREMQIREGNFKQLSSSAKTAKVRDFGQFANAFLGDAQPHFELIATPLLTRNPSDMSKKGEG